MALRWGIFSTGKICSDFANVLNYLPDEEHILLGVAARKKEKAVEFARKHNIPHAFNSYEDLAKDASIDVVYVGSNNAARYALCKLLLSNKKNLLCEIPLSLKYEDTEALIKLAKKKNLFLMEAVWSRCFPVYDRLRNLLASNAIGNVIYLTADFGVPINPVDRIKSKESGGGTIFDLGGYVLQLAILVFGNNPISIAAVGHLNENCVDESINYVLKYDGGKTASFCTHSKIKLNNTAVIYGSEGSIEIKDPFWAPTVISINNEEETYSLPDIKEEMSFIYSRGLMYEAIEVRNCINKGVLESPKMMHDDTLTIAQMQKEVCKLIQAQAKD